MNRSEERMLIEKMCRLGIRQEDIIEHFVKSRGPGGQNVNKTSTCVYLKHLPTGIEVKCHDQRSQALNRYLARRILVEKIEDSILKNLYRQRQNKEKLRRKTRKLPKRIKRRILEAKRRHSEKKQLRAKVLSVE